MKNIIRKRNHLKKHLGYIPITLIVIVGIYYLPPVQSRLAWRLDDLYTRTKYFFDPPDQAVFRPIQTNNSTAIPPATKADTSLTQTAIFTETPASMPAATLAPTVTVTPLPNLISLNGVKYETQSGRNNYCGPTNFSMALTFWGWKGNRTIVGDALMPGNRLGKDGKAGDNDKNVMPYEFQDYISEQVPDMTSVLRYGGILMCSSV
jgi:hypothetical protein